MSKIGAAFLIALWLAAGSAAAAEVTVPHHVTHGAAWGCSDKNDCLWHELKTAYLGKAFPRYAPTTPEAFKAAFKIGREDCFRSARCRVWKPCIRSTSS